MTESEFSKQIWRPYDRVVINEELKYTVHSVSFATRSVRVRMSDGTLEWVRCENIDRHYSQNETPCTTVDTVEDLTVRLKVMTEKYEHQKKLNCDLQRRYKSINDVITCVNLIRDGLMEKKSQIEKIDKALDIVSEFAEMMRSNEDD